MLGKNHIYDAKMFVDGWMAAKPEDQSERMSLLQLGLFVVALGREVQRRLNARDTHYAS